MSIKLWFYQQNSLFARGLFLYSYSGCQPYRSFQEYVLKQQESLFTSTCPGVTDNVTDHLTKFSLTEQVMGWIFIQIIVNTYSSPETPSPFSFLNNQSNLQIRINLPQPDRYLSKLHRLNCCSSDCPRQCTVKNQLRLTSQRILIRNFRAPI